MKSQKIVTNVADLVQLIATFESLSEGTFDDLVSLANRLGLDDSSETVKQSLKALLVEGSQMPEWLSERVAALDASAGWSD